MMVTAETLTDRQIRRELRFTTSVSVGADCAIALNFCARTANGVPLTDRDRRAARVRIAAAINARRKRTGL